MSRERERESVSEVRADPVEERVREVAQMYAAAKPMSTENPSVKNSSHADTWFLSDPTFYAYTATMNQKQRRKFNDNFNALNDRDELITDMLQNSTTLVTWNK